MMTTRDDARRLVTRMIDCFNTRAFDDAAGLFDPTFVSHPFGADAENSREAWRLLVAKLPAIRLDIDAIHVDGDTVTVRSIVNGTDVTVFGAKPILIETFRTHNGLLAEWWGSTWLPHLS